ncbi:hypothetical protein V8F06_007321 [Rhypophila decipiens]
MAPEINSTDITYDPYYKVLVCLKCQEVIKDALGPHPSSRHDVRITKESWDRFLPRLNALGFKQNDNPNSRDIKLPEQGSPPIIGVDIRSGFQCWLCNKTRRASRYRENDHVPGCGRPTSWKRKVQWFGSHQTLPVLDPSEEVEWPKGKKLAPTNLENEVAKRYLDHYEKRTSQTLPPPGNPPPGNKSSEKSYWSITVIDMAKRVQKRVVQSEVDPDWLISGLLMLSAYHLASIFSRTALDPQIVNHASIVHKKIGDAYRDTFMAGLNKLDKEEVKRICGNDSTREGEFRKELEMASQINCIRRCYALEFDRVWPDPSLPRRRVCDALMGILYPPEYGDELSTPLWFKSAPTEQGNIVATIRDWLGIELTEPLRASCAGIYEDEIDTLRALVLEKTPISLDSAADYPGDYPKVWASMMLLDSLNFMYAP